MIDVNSPAWKKFVADFIAAEGKPLRPRNELDGRGRTYIQFVAKFLINEIYPLEKKYGFYPSEKFVNCLAVLIFEGTMQTAQARKILSEHCEWVKEGCPPQ